jgi:putative tricarboxylic transport membrane protein
MSTAVTNLGHGFAVALLPANLVWCFVGVLIGNLVGVLPGLGVLSTVSILLPLTFGMKPVAAILMLAGIYYGAQYGGAICSILLNLPCHPPHAVTCLDGYPLTRKGKGGAALGISIIAACIGASFGIVEMTFFAPVVARFALDFGPPDICALMLLGLLAGATLARGSPLKGVAMTLFGQILGLAGVDMNTGTPRFTFGMLDLYDGVELVALALGLFGIAEFLKSVNRIPPIHPGGARLAIRDLLPNRAELREGIPAMFRGTLVGSLCAMVPGTGPTIASFVAYAVEKKISRTPERFGTGMIAGVAGPEASTHSSVQGDFIPTMSMGIPGDSGMALLLGALMIQGIQPGPLLISQHPDIFWGLIASFWVGNLLLVILNVPLIGLWVRLLAIPYRVLYPCALFFICIGVYSAKNSLFEVAEALAFGLLGYGLIRMRFQVAPILLGFVLGPRMEENFRNALAISGGSLSIFVTHPISAVFLTLCLVLILGQVYARLVRRRGPSTTNVAGGWRPAPADQISADEKGNAR